MTEKTDANRRIEMYRLHGWQAGQHTWDTVMVEIPSTTLIDRIEEVARIHAEAQYGPGAYMLYNSMDDECPDIPHRSEVRVRLCFDMDQTTVGSEIEQQAAAIVQINLTLQRDPYGLGASLSH